MRWSDVPFTPTPKTLRQFAVLWLLFFGALTVWQGLARARPAVAAILAAVALVVGVPGLVNPRAIRPVFVGWMILAFPIGWTVSLLLLALIYFGVFMPVGLAFRLAGRDVLSLRPGPDRESYWEPHEEPADVKRYFRQF